MIPNLLKSWDLLKNYIPDYKCKKKKEQKTGTAFPSSRKKKDDNISRVKIGARRSKKQEIKLLWPYKYQIIF